MPLIELSTVIRAPQERVFDHEARRHLAREPGAIGWPDRGATRSGGHRRQIGDSTRRREILPSAGKFAVARGTPGHGLLTPPISFPRDSAANWRVIDPRSGIRWVIPGKARCS